MLLHTKIINIFSSFKEVNQNPSLLISEKGFINEHISFMGVCLLFIYLKKLILYTYFKIFIIKNKSIVLLFKSLNYKKEFVFIDVPSCWGCLYK